LSPPLTFLCSLPPPACCWGPFSFGDPPFFFFFTRISSRWFGSFCPPPPAFFCHPSAVGVLLFPMAPFLKFPPGLGSINLLLIGPCFYSFSKPLLGFSPDSFITSRIDILGATLGNILCPCFFPNTPNRPGRFFFAAESSPSWFGDPLLFCDKVFISLSPWQVFFYRPAEFFVVSSPPKLGAFSFLRFSPPLPPPYCLVTFGPTRHCRLPSFESVYTLPCPLIVFFSLAQHGAISLPGPGPFPQPRLYLSFFFGFSFLAVFPNLLVPLSALFRSLFFDPLNSPVGAGHRTQTVHPP